MTASVRSKLISETYDLASEYLTIKQNDMIAQFRNIPTYIFTADAMAFNFQQQYNKPVNDVQLRATARTGLNKSIYNTRYIDFQLPNEFACAYINSLCPSTNISTHYRTPESSAGQITEIKSLAEIANSVDDIDIDLFADVIDSNVEDVYPNVVDNIYDYFIEVCADEDQYDDYEYEDDDDDDGDVVRESWYEDMSYDERVDYALDNYMFDNSLLETYNLDLSNNVKNAIDEHVNDVFISELVNRYIEYFEDSEAFLNIEIDILAIVLDNNDVLIIDRDRTTNRLSCRVESHMPTDDELLQSNYILVDNAEHLTFVVNREYTPIINHSEICLNVDLSDIGYFINIDRLTDPTIELQYACLRLIDTFNFSITKIPSLPDSTKDFRLNEKTLQVLRGLRFTESMDLRIYTLTSSSLSFSLRFHIDSLNINIPYVPIFKYDGSITFFEDCDEAHTYAKRIIDDTFGSNILCFSDRSLCYKIPAYNLSDRKRHKIFDAVAKLLLSVTDLISDDKHKLKFQYDVFQKGIAFHLTSYKTYQIYCVEKDAIISLNTSSEMFKEFFVKKDVAKTVIVHAQREIIADTDVQSQVKCLLEHATRDKIVYTVTSMTNDHKALFFSDSIGLSKIRSYAILQQGYSYNNSSNIVRGTLLVDVPLIVVSPVKCISGDNVFCIQNTSAFSRSPTSSIDFISRGLVISPADFTEKRGSLYKNLPKNISKLPYVITLPSSQMDLIPYLVGDLDISPSSIALIYSPRGPKEGIAVVHISGSVESIHNFSIDGVVFEKMPKRDEQKIIRLLTGHCEIPYQTYRLVPALDSDSIFFASKESLGLQIQTKLNSWQINCLRLLGLFLNAKRVKELKKVSDGATTSLVDLVMPYSIEEKEVIASSLKFIEDEQRIKGPDVLPANLVTSIYAYELACVVKNRWGEHMANITLPLLNVDAHLRAYSDLAKTENSDLLDILYLQNHSMVNQVLKNRFYGNAYSNNTVQHVDFRSFEELEIVQHKRLYCFVDTIIRPLSILSQLCARSENDRLRDNPFIGERDDTGRFGSFEDSFLGYLEARTELHSQIIMDATLDWEDNSSEVPVSERRILIFNIAKNETSKSAPVILVTCIQSPVYKAAVYVCENTQTPHINEGVQSVNYKEIRQFLLDSCAGSVDCISVHDLLNELHPMQDALNREYVALESFYATSTHSSSNMRTEAQDTTRQTHVYPLNIQKQLGVVVNSPYNYLGSIQLSSHAEKIIPEAFLYYAQIAMRIAELDDIFNKLLSVKKDSEIDPSVEKAINTLTGSKKLLPNLVDLKRNIINGSIQKGTGLYEIALNKETIVKHVAEDGSAEFKAESVITAKLAGHTAAYQVLFNNISRLDGLDRHSDFETAIRELSEPSALNMDDLLLGQMLRPKSRFPNEEYTDFSKPSNLNAYDFEVLLYPSEYAALLQVVSNCLDEISALENEAEVAAGSSRILYADTFGRNVSQAGVRLSENDPSVLVKGSEARYVKDLQGYSRRYNFCIGKAGFGYTTGITQATLEVFRFEDADKTLLSVITVSYSKDSDCGVLLYEANAAGNDKSCAKTANENYANACCFILRYFREIGLCTLGFVFESINISIGDTSITVESESEFKAAEKSINKIIKDSKGTLSDADIKVDTIGRRGFRYAEEMYLMGVVVQDTLKLPEDLFFEPALLFALRSRLKRLDTTVLASYASYARKQFFMTPQICETLRGASKIEDVQLALFRKKLVNK